MRILLILILSGFLYTQAYRPLMAERHFFLSKVAPNQAQAEEHILKALELDPHNTVYLHRAATLALHMGRTGARDFIERSIVDHNGDIIRWAQWYLKGEVAMASGSLLEAQAAFEKALWYNSEFGEARKKLEQVKGILKEHDKVLIKIR